jgi:hypothetical protein
MPVLPIDATEPFAATLGVMLYPGADESSKARAFTAQYLAKPLQDFHDAGYRLPYEQLADFAFANTETLADQPTRNRDALVFGDVVAMYFMLWHSRPELASWNHAIQLVEATIPTGGGSRTTIVNAKRRFRSVAHLWGALSLRSGRFSDDLSVGYTGRADFQSFLAEAEIVLAWGTNARHHRKGASPFTGEMWSVPSTWRPVERRAGWPSTGVVRLPELPDESLLSLRRSGRPKRAAQNLDITG